MSYGLSLSISYWYVVASVSKHVQQYFNIVEKGLSFSFSEQQIVKLGNILYKVQMHLIEKKKKRNRLQEIICCTKSKYPHNWQNKNKTKQTNKISVMELFAINYACVLWKWVTIVSVTLRMHSSKCRLWMYFFLTDVQTFWFLYMIQGKIFAW